MTAQQLSRSSQTAYMGPMGSVTGHVVASDTQTPARFAQVSLVPFEATTTGDFSHRSAALTDLDGGFAMMNVAPGDYYVVASGGGYISAALVLQTALAAGADPRTAFSALPEVHVSSNAASTVNLSLQRGGVITGKLQWDDGSPASGVQVSATPEGASATPPLPGLAMMGLEGVVRAVSDDRGEFRLVGLPPASYIVAAAMTVPTPGGPGGTGRMFNVTLYSPGKARKSDAKAIAVTAAEEHDEASFTLDLKSFHKVSGQVSSTSGPSVTSGSVRLVDSIDSSLTRPAMIEPDGSFAVSYVPEGTYTLEVSAGSATSGSRSRASFLPTKTTVTVTDSDVTGVNVDASPVSGAQ